MRTPASRTDRRKYTSGNRSRRSSGERVVETAAVGEAGEGSWMSLRSKADGAGQVREAVLEGEPDEQGRWAGPGWPDEERRARPDGWAILSR